MYLLLVLDLFLRELTSRKQVYKHVPGYLRMTVNTCETFHYSNCLRVASYWVTLQVTYAAMGDLVGHLVRVYSESVCK